MKASDYKPRLVVPDKNDLRYILSSYGGWYNGIPGHKKLLYFEGSCLSNCVGYAFGRFNEISGRTPANMYYVGCYKGLKKPTSAGYWFSVKDGFERGQEAKLGAVACWGKYSNGKLISGHVAIVEKIEGDKITVSESGYGTYLFRLNSYKNMVKSGYKFLGYIYNPDVEDDPVYDDFKVGDKVRIVMRKAGNARSDGKGLTANGYHYIRYINKIVPNAEYPYDIGSNKKVRTGFYKKEAIEHV